MFRKTKIICTLGPSTDQPGIMEGLIDAGMNVARFNFSHGDHEEQRGRFVSLKKARNNARKPVAALLDTKGPEIRLKNFAEGKVLMKKGQTFTLTTKEIDGDDTQVAITYKNLVNDVKPGNMILIDDGLVGMEVKEVNDTDIVCEVLNSGQISNHKGVNVPDVSLPIFCSVLRMALILSLPLLPERRTIFWRSAKFWKKKTVIRFRSSQRLKIWKGSTIWMRS